MQLILKDNHFRMAMLVTLFLVLINIFNSVRYSTNIVNCDVLVYIERYQADPSIPVTILMLHKQKYFI